MKHTLFIAVFAAVAGNQLFAEETTLTQIGGAEPLMSGGEIYGYAGAVGETQAATGGNVVLQIGEEGLDLTNKSIYGGYATETSGMSAHDNTVSMSGGDVSVINGACAAMGSSPNAAAYNNTVIVSSGTVKTVNAALANEGAVYGNVIIVTGGQVTGVLRGGSAGGDVHDNKIYLLGKGGTATIKDGQGNPSSYSYTGNDEGLSLGSLYAGQSYGSAATNNSIDLFGYGTTAKIVKYTQVLNFHIVDELATTGTTALTLTGTSASDLSNTVIGLNADAVKDWSLFEGKTITLVQAQKAIQGLENPVQVQVMQGDKVLTTATLKLAGEGTLLQMTVQGNVPEPATGTLGLLALAGLAARRRRK